VGGQLSAEVRVTSGVSQGSVLGPLLFIAYVNDIWRNMESTISLFADDCVIYRKIINSEDMDELQKELNRLGKWAVENAIKINPSKSKAIRFTRARVKNPLNYSLMGTLVPEASSCKYFGIILRSDLSWADQVNYTVEKAWKALHFTVRILKRVIVAVTILCIRIAHTFSHSTCSPSEGSSFVCTPHFFFSKFSTRNKL